MKYAHYNKTDGKLIGWYDGEVHGTYTPEVQEELAEDGSVLTAYVAGYYDASNIPTPNIEVSEEDWQEAIEENANYVDVKKKTLSVKDFRTKTEIIENTKASKIGEINKACAMEILGGFISDALGIKHKYRSDQIDQLNLIGVVAGGTDDYFKCSEDIDKEGEDAAYQYKMHTALQLLQVLNDGKAYKQTLLQKGATLKSQIAKATTVKKIEAISW